MTPSVTFDPEYMEQLQTVFKRFHSDQTWDAHPAPPLQVRHRHGNTGTAEQPPNMADGSVKDEVVDPERNQRSDETEQNPRNTMTSPQLLLLLLLLTLLLLVPTAAATITDM